MKAPGWSSASSETCLPGSNKKDTACVAQGYIIKFSYGIIFEVTFDAGRPYGGSVQTYLLRDRDQTTHTLYLEGYPILAFGAFPQPALLDYRTSLSSTRLGRQRLILKLKSRLLKECVSAPMEI
jgi:hypothetical protein